MQSHINSDSHLQQRPVLLPAASEVGWVGHPHSEARLLCRWGPWGRGAPWPLAACLTGGYTADV